MDLASLFGVATWRRRTRHVPGSRGVAVGRTRERTASDVAGRGSPFHHGVSLVFLRGCVPSWGAAAGNGEPFVPDVVAAGRRVRVPKAE